MVCCDVRFNKLERQSTWPIFFMADFIFFAASLVNVLCPWSHQYPEVSILRFHPYCFISHTREWLALQRLLFSYTLPSHSGSFEIWIEVSRRRVTLDSCILQACKTSFMWMSIWVSLDLYGSLWTTASIWEYPRSWILEDTSLSFFQMILLFQILEAGSDRWFSG